MSAVGIFVPPDVKKTTGEWRGETAWLNYRQNIVLTLNYCRVLE